MLTPSRLYWRRLEILLSKKVPGLPSLGHAVILGLFLAVNLILSFTSIVSLATNYLASRFGWYVNLFILGYSRMLTAI